MAKFCPECGTPLDPTAYRCINCGTNVTPNATPNNEQSRFEYTVPQYVTGDPQQPSTPPKTYLVESILVTLFCCLPFGIVGIINAAKVDGLFQGKKFVEAQRASDDAKKWVLWGAITGAIVIFLYVLFVVVVGLAEDI